MANVEDEHTPGPAKGGRGSLDRGGLIARPREDDDAMDPEEYARLLDSYDNSFRNIAEGEVVKGTVLKVTPSEVIVDVGYKSEGIISIDEFLDETGQVTVEAGDLVDVLLERTEDREGYVVLSREKAEKMKIWDEVEKAYADRKVVIGRVIERIKGGLAVDIGVRAFLPGSQIDVRPVRNLDALRGQELRMRVIKVNKKRGNIVLSRKALLEEENAEKKKHTLETLAEGKVLRGVVKNITDYGAFIDLGGIDGLLHITDMSWGRVGHPSELFKVNDEIDVVVLKYDAATERVSLGHKQLITDPWANVMDRYPVGARMSGKVVSLTDYGAFRDLQRHRMLTLEWQPLSTRHGYVLPAAVEEFGALADWRAVMEASAALHDALVARGREDVAPYSVVMAYRVRFYMDMNGARQGQADYKSSTRDTKRLIDDFRTKGVDCICLDLRNNGGGSLPEAISLTGLFIDTGVLTLRDPAAAQREHTVDSELVVEWRALTVALLDRLADDA